MKHKQFTLPNGIKCLFISNRHLDITSIDISCKVGSKHENSNNYGISHLLEHMFFKGTPKYKNNKALTSEIESLGGIMNANTSQNKTTFVIKINSKYTKKSIDILADMLLHSSFKKTDLKYEQNITIAELNKYIDDPHYLLIEMFNKSIFKNTPLENLPIGTIKTINNTTRSSLLNYKNKYYTADNIFITITSNISFVRIQHMLQHSEFSQFKSSELKKNMPFLYSNPSNYTLHVKYRNIEQDKIVLGFPVCDIHNKDKYVLNCISNLLTNGLSSILFIELREKNSLVYDISSSTDLYNDIGTFNIYTGTSSSKVIDYTEHETNLNITSLVQTFFRTPNKKLKNGVLHIILDEIVSLTKKKITLDQLKAVKNTIKSTLLFGTEDSDTITDYYSEQLLFNCENITSIKRLHTIYDKITPDDILRVSKKYFTKNNLFVSILGQSKQYKVKTFLDNFKHF